jgi:hypothetical protein
MKLFGGLIVVALAGALLISEGHERYKEWSLHHRPFEPPPRNRSRGMGDIRLVTQHLLDMRDGETSRLHYRDVTRRDATWTTDGLTFRTASAAAEYL